MDAQHLDAAPVLDIGVLDRHSTPLNKANGTPEKPKSN
jgi:hypothetical protein